MVWGCASRALDSERGSGDRGLVLRHASGILLAVVDGLGHGATAAEAAQSATAALERFAEPDLRRVLQNCHGRMKGTRGATMALAWIDLSTSLLSWLGMGNVAGILHRARRDPPSTPLMPQFGGIVGRHISAGNPARVRIGAGDTIVLATDGVRRGFADHVPDPRRAEVEIAEKLIAAHASDRDDALVLVARCTASQS